MTPPRTRKVAETAPTDPVEDPDATPAEDGLTDFVADQRAMLRKLREPFPSDQIGKLPRTTCRDCSDDRRKRCDRHQWVTQCPICGKNHTSATMHLDYVGHAYLTARLLDVDPFWSWEPMATDQFGLPVLDREGNLWIRLTVGGMTRVGVGDGKNAKERIGDALRNAAMRYGCALEMWAKGEIELDKQDDTPEGERTYTGNIGFPPGVSAPESAEQPIASLEDERDRAWRRWKASVPDGTQEQFMAAICAVTGVEWPYLSPSDFAGFWKGMTR